jgi:hypothetical protein
MELDERINPDAIHRISIGKEYFDMFGHKLIELLNNPSKAELCIGSVPKKWVDDPEALSHYLWGHEHCITVPLGCSRGNISAKQYADWLFGLVEFGEEAVTGLRTELQDCKAEGITEDVKSRLEKALECNPRESDKILLRHLKEAWVASVGLEVEVTDEPDDLVDSVMSDFDPDPDDNRILKDLFQELFLHEQKQDIRKLCRYMGLHHIADKAAELQLTSVPKIRQLALP